MYCDGKMVIFSFGKIVIFIWFALDFLSAREILLPTEWTVNAGENVTLPCFPNSAPHEEQVMWVKDDRSERMKDGWIKVDGSLSLPAVVREDSGVYTCARDELNSSSEAEDLHAHELSEVEDAVRSKYNLIVRSNPGPLVNVSVHASTVLASLFWDVGDTGGSEIVYFSAQHRAVDSDEWLTIQPKHISPSTRLIDVYHLTPNTTYIFEIWSTNEIGPGQKTTLEATTRHVIEEIELARHLLQGVENFDTRVWVVAVSIVMGTLVVLSIGTCYLMFRDYHVTVWTADEHETMELVPNITLNPGYDDVAAVRLSPDENYNHQPLVAFNNTSIVRPIRVSSFYTGILEFHTYFCKEKVL